MEYHPNELEERLNHALAERWRGRRASVRAGQTPSNVRFATSSSPSLWGETTTPAKTLQRGASADTLAPYTAAPLKAIKARAASLAPVRRPRSTAASSPAVRLAASSPAAYGRPAAELAPLVPGSSSALKCPNEAAAVEAAVAEREATLAELRSLTSTLVSVRRALRMPWRGAGGSRVQLSTQVRDAQRARLAEIVHALRDTAVRIAEAVEVWRRAVASSSPPPPLGSTARPPYLHRGHNVLVRLLVDAPALPLPLMSDPLLVRWFGAHAPLWAGDGAADAAAFAPPSTERRRLEHAAALLRAEARQYALVVSDGRQAAPSPESEELQLLLYGTASFGESLAVLELLHATTVVQNFWRRHLENKHLTARRIEDSAAKFAKAFAPPAGVCTRTHRRCVSA